MFYLISEISSWGSHIWLVALASSISRSKPKWRISLDLFKAQTGIRPRDNLGFQEDNKFNNINHKMLNFNPRRSENVSKGPFRNDEQYEINTNNNTNKDDSQNAVDKMFKTSPAAKMLSRNEENFDN
ncbi:DCD (Development and Cell Death) domain protein [Striga asiatica]|uniref:DCD (Development and Cell Death) domain protein n=1 Tax=Striga asiatica TaxID=4170 RepID=A0A5A7PFL6_STRAF|nr:DCD (Development and Cell Death) domain protein [Striga asiatica]